MRVTCRQFGGGINVLMFDHYVSVPYTVDFSKISEVADNRSKIIKAGTPMAKGGIKATVTDGKSNAIGILMHDCYEDRPTTSLIIHGFIDKSKAELNTGETYTAEVLNALPMVSFL